MQCPLIISHISLPWPWCKSWLCSTASSRDREGSLLLPVECQVQLSTWSPQHCGGWGGSINTCDRYESPSSCPVSADPTLGTRWAISSQPLTSPLSLCQYRWEQGYSFFCGIWLEQHLLSTLSVFLSCPISGPLTRKVWHLLGTCFLCLCYHLEVIVFSYSKSEIGGKNKQQKTLVTHSHVLPHAPKSLVSLSSSLLLSSSYVCFISICLLY